MTGLTLARAFALAALAAVCALLAVPVLASAEGTPAPSYVDESRQAYEQQLQKGEIASATFNRKVRSLRLTLKNGEHVLYHYLKAGAPPLESALRSKGVPVKILTAAEAKKEVHKHHRIRLRYIAGGILILVIIVVGIVLLVNVRRRRTAD
jgi:hypothetical protein